MLGKCHQDFVVLAICPSVWVQNMASVAAPPKLPRFQPSGDVCLLVVGDDLPLLPLPALATWDRPALIRFYSAHQDLKQDMMKKRTRGVCTLRFQEHCQRIPQRIRELHNIDAPVNGGPRCNQNGRAQSVMCRKIDGLLDVAMAFWGSVAE